MSYDQNSRSECVRKGPTCTSSYLDSVRNIAYMWRTTWEFRRRPIDWRP